MSHNTFELQMTMTIYSNINLYFRFAAVIHYGDWSTDFDSETLKKNENFVFQRGWIPITFVECHYRLFKSLLKTYERAYTFFKYIANITNNLK